MKKTSILVIMPSLFLSACSVVQLKPESSHVVFAADSEQVRNCQYLGEVIGTEGHWYNSLFISNRTLMQAALDDIRNQATEKGADTIYMKEPYTFGTSVTMLGFSYRCQPANN